MKEIASYRLNVNGLYSHISAMSNSIDKFALFLPNGEYTKYETEEALIHAFTAYVAHYAKEHFKLFK